MDEIQPKVLLLAIQSDLYSLPWDLYFFKLTQPLTGSTVWWLHCKGERRKTWQKPPLPSLCFRNPYKNLTSENSQDYAQQPQRNCTFMNWASGYVYVPFIGALMMWVTHRVHILVEMNPQDRYTRVTADRENWNWDERRRNDMKAYRCTQHCPCPGCPSVASHSHYIIYYSPTGESPPSKKETSRWTVLYRIIWQLLHCFSFH